MQYSGEQKVAKWAENVAKVCVDSQFERGRTHKGVTHQCVSRQLLTISQENVLIVPVIPAGPAPEVSDCIAAKQKSINLLIYEFQQTSISGF